MTITAVTCLLDIGREGSDGRKIEDYISWLNETLKAPFDFIIFLDSSICRDCVAAKPNDKIIPISLSEVPLFSNLEVIRDIIRTKPEKQRKDLTYKLPDYGALVQSKFFFLRLAADLSIADHLLWIDAGLSRFLPDLSFFKTSQTYPEIGSASILLSTSYYLSQRTRIGKIPHRAVGKSMAFTSAGDFLVKRRFCRELELRIMYMIESEWWPLGMWDNEQVALGILLHRGGLPDARILKTDADPLAPTTRWLLGIPFREGDLKPSVFWRLIRDEIKVRVEPQDCCYLKDDFPEQDYQRWRERLKV